MKHWTTIIGAAVVATLTVPTLAVAQNAYSIADVNMRAGPAADFPIVTTIPEDRAVTIHGCVGGYEWCDVSCATVEAGSTASIWTMPEAASE